ncbi:serpin family protein [bacterium]|nr:serpin family protein [bacterium]
MYRISSLIFVLVFALISVLNAGSKSPEKTDVIIIPSLIEGNNLFASEMYKQLATEEGNIFFSPYSISSAMAMTYGGAKGNTAIEITSALNFYLENDIHPAFGNLQNQLQTTAKTSGIKLDIANALCLTGGDVESSYKSLLEKYYFAEVFKGDLKKINSWVKDKTEDKIEKILDKLDANSVCVILNAIYFKGTWNNSFKKEYTYDSEFYTSDESSVPVKLMYQNEQFKLVDMSNYRALELPYSENAMSMVILLPEEIGGLTKLEKKLDLKECLSKLDAEKPKDVKVYIPKFKLETSYSLIPAFQQLGMVDAFKPDVADFSGMGWPKGDLWISQIMHKAIVEVSEEGTEAAAATAVEMVTKAVYHDTTPVFRVDHPIIFIIRDNQTGSILFIGRLVEPSYEDKK